MMTKLCNLAVKWGVDKTPSIHGDVPLSGHDYTPYYHEIFQAMKVRKLFEIGLGLQRRGIAPDGLCASLFMWQEYFPEADIYGVDIEDIFVNEGRIKSFYCDQSDEASLLNAMAKTGGNFDVMIDDGSHVPAHQILSAKVLFPFLAPNGVYVIEDVAKPDVVLAALAEYSPELKVFHPELTEDDDRLVILHGKPSITSL